MAEKHYNHVAMLNAQIADLLERQAEEATAHRQAAQAAALEMASAEATMAQKEVGMEGVLGLRCSQAVAAHVSPLRCLHTALVHCQKLGAFSGVCPCLFHGMDHLYRAKQGLEQQLEHSQTFINACPGIDSSTSLRTLPLQNCLMRSSWCCVKNAAHLLSPAVSLLLCKCACACAHVQAENERLRNEMGKMQQEMGVLASAHKSTLAALAKLRQSLEAAMPGMEVGGLH
eukprot:1138698-Pelagomonas_calceolata.AAC.3